MTRAEKIGAGVGAVLGHGILSPVIGFGFVPFAIGAGFGYWFSRRIARRAAPTDAKRVT